MFSLIQEVQRNLESPLIIKKMTNFKKGFKKHRNNKKLMVELNELLGYIIYNKLPPEKFNLHMLKNGALKGFFNAHLLGQQILIVYGISDTHLTLVGLGSHRELGIQ